MTEEASHTEMTIHHMPFAQTRRVYLGMSSGESECQAPKDAASNVTTEKLNAHVRHV